MTITDASATPVVTPLDPDVDPATETDARVLVATQRLRSAAARLLGDGAAELPDEPGDLLHAVVEDLRRAPDPERLWLLWAALAGAYPSADELAEARRHLAVLDPADGEVRLLDAALVGAGRAGTPTLPVEVVTGQVLVDVDFTARHDLHTGIQRVVRSFLPHWVADHDVVPVVWHPGYGAYRRLDAVEARRALEWGTEHPAADEQVAPSRATALVVPDRCVVVVPEVPAQAACARLAGLAQSSSNVVAVVGHDCIPVVSADRLPLAEPNRFVQFLALVKHVTRLSAVSASSAEEFRGFCSMLSAQGLTGPEVVVCPLPVAIPDAATARASSRPLVLCVGSFEPRKNQMAVLFAAEMLWREGLQFDLRLIGGGQPTGDFRRRAAQLARTRPLSVEVAVSEQRLEQSYRDAAFVVFPSLHEGYGLPVAEALGHGTPVLTSALGSMQEVATGGGALTVDPRDDDAVLDGMRRLLTEPELLERLRTELVARPRRTWTDFAAELWDVLVVPLRQDLTSDARVGR